MAAANAECEGYVEANGIRFHYVERGQGPLVLLLHGWPEFCLSWRHQLPALAEAGYRAVAPDLRGFNLSDKPRTGYDLDTLGRDIAGLIEALGASNADLVAHDWGGAAAWYAATFHAARIRKLVVLNCPHPCLMFRGILRPAQLKRSSYIFFFQLPWLPERLLARNEHAAIARAIRGSAFRKEAFPRNLLDRYREAAAQPGALSAGLAYYRRTFRDLVTGRLRPWPDKVRVPTLVVWGERDRALGKELNDGLPGLVEDLTLAYVQDSGHWIQQEKPELVNLHLTRFLGPAADRGV